MKDKILFYKSLYEPYSDKGRKIFLSIEYDGFNESGLTESDMEKTTILIILFETWEYWCGE